MNRSSPVTVDIVERLRRGADDAWLDCYAMYEEAAARIEALEKMATDSDAELTQLTHTVKRIASPYQSDRGRWRQRCRDCIQIADDFECHLCGYPNHEAEQYYDSGVIDASNMIAERIRARARDFKEVYVHTQT